MANNDAPSGVRMSLWEHLDELRGCIIRMLVAIILTGGFAFCMKESLFDIVLAPHSSDFITWRWLDMMPFQIHLMNTGLTEQFMIHITLSLYAGLLLASPYLLYELSRFISPALYKKERYYCTIAIFFASVLFIFGTIVNYLLVFPLTVRFLGTYQVSDLVSNMLTIRSYIDTFIAMSLVMGVVFELPIVCWILGRIGILNGTLMKRYRRHAIIVMLIIAAIITPTTDVFTLLIVFLPIWLLYKVSILVVKKSRASERRAKFT